MANQASAAMCGASEVCKNLLTEELAKVGSANLSDFWSVLSKVGSVVSQVAQVALPLAAALL